MSSWCMKPSFGLEVAGDERDEHEIKKYGHKSERARTFDSGWKWRDVSRMYVLNVRPCLPDRLQSGVTIQSLGNHEVRSDDCNAAAYARGMRSAR